MLEWFKVFFLLKWESWEGFVGEFFCDWFVLVIFLLEYLLKEGFFFIEVCLLSELFLLLRIRYIEGMVVLEIWVLEIILEDMVFWLVSEYEDEFWGDLGFFLEYELVFLGGVGGVILLRIFLLFVFVLVNFFFVFWGLWITLLILYRLCEFLLRDNFFFFFLFISVSLFFRSLLLLWKDV